MKKITNLVSCVILLLVVQNAHGAYCASFYMSNLGPAPFSVPIYDALGNPLTGENFVAQLFGAPTMDQLEPARDRISLNIAAPVPFTVPIPGFFAAPFVLVKTDPAGGSSVWLQVRVWDTHIAPTYDEVAELGNGGYGESELFQSVGGYACSVQGSPPALLIGLESFSLTPAVPEPGATLILLVAVPLIAWSVYRRRSTNGRVP
jgi:hypothetical protein